MVYYLFWAAYSMEVSAEAFEKFFGVKPEGRTNEKISLIPPDDFEEDDDELKFRGFFKKKNKK
ncbi:MAG: hypothetical protein K2F65_03280, partial [Eubacterium sp.]|nr:hypothetical protein [Eubacterium sp.]